MKIVTQVKSCDYWKSLPIGTVLELIADGETALCLKEGWARATYQYMIPPIDGFIGVIQLDEFKKSLEKSDYREESKYFSEGAGRILAELEKEMKTLKEWEGDIRNKEIYVFAVPDEMETSIGLVWKQDNNGTTFIISPVELPHLQKYMESVGYCEERDQFADSE